ncbi:MAG: hypothetical protein ACLRXU_04520 [Barnesiella intestinihominis]
MKLKKFFLQAMICILSLPLFAASNGSPNAIRVNWLKKYNPDKLSVISFHNFIYMEDITCDKEEIIPASLDYIIAINGKKDRFHSDRRYISHTQRARWPGGTAHALHRSRCRL